MLLMMQRPAVWETGLGWGIGRCVSIQLFLFAKKM